jgi:hypothetical protein
MSRLSRYILLFSVTFAVLLVAPAFLGGQLPIYPLMTWGDALDIITPLVLLPLYWLLFWYGSGEKMKLGESLIFVVLAAMWAEGHGMHLSVNSIGHLLEEAIHVDAFILTSFYDEKLSHYLWHLGIVGLAALLIYRACRKPTCEDRIMWSMIIPAGIIHGFTFFLIVIEAGTAPLGISFVLLLPLVVLIWGRDKLKSQPLISFYFMSCLVAILFFIGWGIYWSGLPEFSEVGII